MQLPLRQQLRCLQQGEHILVWHERTHVNQLFRATAPRCHPCCRLVGGIRNNVDRMSSEVMLLDESFRGVRNGNDGIRAAKKEALWPPREVVRAPQRTNDNVELSWWRAVPVVDEIVNGQNNAVATAERTHGLHG